MQKIQWCCVNFEWNLNIIVGYIVKSGEVEMWFTLRYADKSKILKKCDS